MRNFKLSRWLLLFADSRGSFDKFLQYMFAFVAAVFVILLLHAYMVKGEYCITVLYIVICGRICEKGSSTHIE